MANNENVNKVVYGNTTLIDLTQDSVTSETLLEDETAHDRSGAQITGTAKQGHTIWNAIKTALTQRSKLWFADAKATDDTTEQATKIEVVQLIDDEDELDDAPDGVYQGDYEESPEDVLDASMVAYGNGSVEDALDEINAEISDLTGYVEVIGDGVKTRSQILDALYALADKTKINEKSALNFDVRVYHFTMDYSGIYFFGSTQCSSGNMNCAQCQLKSSGSVVEQVTSAVGGGTTYTNGSSVVSVNGRPYRLYY